jgi:tetratricopeptide (TPR) repeat protein
VAKRSGKSRLEKDSEIQTNQENMETETVEKYGFSDVLRNEEFIVTILIVVTAIVFFNSLNGQFLYDDWFQIERNPTLHSWSNLPKMFTESVWQFMDSGNSQAVGPYYRPIFNASLLINYQLFGLNVVGWHLFSILLHIGTTLFVYVLARKWGICQTVSAVAALLFAVHPVHSEAVAWASSTPDILTGFFTLAALICYESARKAEKINWFWMTASLICTLLAMGSKETGVLIPIFFVFREVIESWFKQENTFSVGKISSISVPFFLCAFSYLAARYAVLGFISKTHPLAKDVTNWEMFLTIPNILLQYIRMLFVPYPLAFIYDYIFVQNLSDIRFWGAVLILIGLIGAFVWLISKSPNAIKCAAIFFVFIIPALNLKAFSPQESLIHDRYLYLPSVGFCLLLAMGLNWTVKRFKKSKEILKLFVAATLIISIGFGILTILQNRTWQNDEVLAKHALKYAPNWAFLNIHLGEVFAENKEYDKAVPYLQKAIEIQPNGSAGYASLGYVYSVQGKFEEAEKMFQKAIGLGSPYPKTWINLGINSTKLGKLPEAEIAFTNALRLNFENIIALYQLGIVQQNQGKYEAAEKSFRKVLEINPQFIDARLNLAALFSSQKRLSDALEQIRLAREIDPENDEILLTEGGIYLQASNCEKAVQTLEELIKKNPEHPKVYVVLGLSYECLNQKDKAIQSYGKAIELAPNEPSVEIARRNLEKLKNN